MVKAPRVCLLPPGGTAQARHALYILDRLRLGRSARYQIAIAHARWDREPPGHPAAARHTLVGCKFALLHPVDVFLPYTNGALPLRKRRRDIQPTKHTAALGNKKRSLQQNRVALNHCTALSTDTRTLAYARTLAPKEVRENTAAAQPRRLRAVLVGGTLETTPRRHHAARARRSTHMFGHWLSRRQQVAPGQVLQTPKFDKRAGSHHPLVLLCHALSTSRAVGEQRGPYFAPGTSEPRKHGHICCGHSIGVYQELAAHHQVYEPPGVCTSHHACWGCESRRACPLRAARQKELRSRRSLVYIFSTRVPRLQGKRHQLQPARTHMHPHSALGYAPPPPRRPHHKRQHRTIGTHSLTRAEPLAHCQRAHHCRLAGFSPPALRVQP